MIDCIFCKIIKKEIPADKIYEDKNVLAFLDIMPINEGHTLVISKKHYEDFLTTDEETLKNLIIAVKKITKAVIKAVNAEGFNLVLNNKRVAGQLIPHVHFHIIPRFKRDGLKHWSGKKYKENESKLIASKIKSFL